MHGSIRKQNQFKNTQIMEGNEDEIITKKKGKKNLNEIT